jgi:predicted neutral ceramidase superfamily lipid hydrolase
LHCALLGVAVSNALLALVPSVLIVALALFLEMFAALLWNVVTVSYRQRFIPDALLGRVNSIYRFFGWGLLPFGALASGAIVVMANRK